MLGLLLTSEVYGGLAYLAGSFVDSLVGVVSNGVIERRCKEGVEEEEDVSRRLKALALAVLVRRVRLVAVLIDSMFIRLEEHCWMSFVPGGGGLL